jgi:hypothetical protein
MTLGWPWSMGRSGGALDDWCLKRRPAGMARRSVEESGSRMRYWNGADGGSYNGDRENAG